MNKYAHLYLDSFQKVAYNYPRDFTKSQRQIADAHINEEVDNIKFNENLATSPNQYGSLSVNDSRTKEDFRNQRTPAVLGKPVYGLDFNQPNERAAIKSFKDNHDQDTSRIMKDIVVKKMQDNPEAYTTVPKFIGKRYLPGIQREQDKEFKAVTTDPDMQSRMSYAAGKPDISDEEFLKRYESNEAIMNPDERFLAEYNANGGKIDSVSGDGQDAVDEITIRKSQDIDQQKPQFRATTQLQQPMPQGNKTPRDILTNIPGNHPLKQVARSNPQAYNYYLKEFKNGTNTPYDPKSPLDNAKMQALIEGKDRWSYVGMS